MARTVEVVPPRQERRTGPRSTTVVLRRVGPWSVFKFSLLFYFCVMLVILAGLIILYWILGEVGVIDSTARFLESIGLCEVCRPDGWLIFSRLFVVGLVLVVFWSLVNLFAAFLFNLISDVLGGVQVTLSERR